MGKKTEKQVDYEAVRGLVEPHWEAMKKVGSLAKRWSDVKADKGTANAPAQLILALEECCGLDVNETINKCWQDAESRQAVADRIKKIREPLQSGPERNPKWLNRMVPILAAASIGLVLGLGIAGLAKTNKSPPTSSKDTLIESKAPPVRGATFVSGSGYHANLYHPVASTEFELELQPNKLLNDESLRPKIVLPFEAAPGDYRIKIWDYRGLLRAKNNVLLFYKNGDKGQFNPSAGLNETLYEHIVRTDEPPEIQFSIAEGTTKISVKAAIEDEPKFSEIPRTHTICIFYCYPDLTFEHSQSLPAEFQSGDKFILHLNVINRGLATAAAGHVSIRVTSTDPLFEPVEVGKQSYQKLETKKNQELAIAVEIPNLVAGNYAGTIMVDSENTSKERDEIFAGDWKNDEGMPFRPKESDKKVIPVNNFGTFPFRIVTSN
jgi:hypothetical protein